MNGSEYVRDFLKRKGIPGDGVQQLLTENLQRFAEEQRAYQEKLKAAENSGDLDQKLSTRGTLYQTRGLSADTSLLVNYALEDTLHSLSVKGLLAKGSIRHIAVIGPGLDFTNKHSGYDFYPFQTIQPFAVMETVLRLKLGKPEDVEVVTMDLNPGVNAHIAKLARDAREGRAYTVQLPRDTAADWPQPAVAYWERFRRNHWRTGGTPLCAAGAGRLNTSRRGHRAGIRFTCHAIEFECSGSACGIGAGAGFRPGDRYQRPRLL